MKITVALLESWNALHLSDDDVKKLERRFYEWGCLMCPGRNVGFLCDFDYGPDQEPPETHVAKEIQRLADCPKKSMTPEEIHKTETDRRKPEAAGWISDIKAWYYENAGDPKAQAEEIEDAYYTITAIEPEWEPDPKRVSGK